MTNSKSIGKWVISLLAVAILGLVAVWLVGGYTEKTAPSVTDQQLPRPTAAIQLQPETVMLFETVPATAQPKQEAIISSRIMASIAAIHVRAGDEVKQGDLLVTLDAKDLQAKVQQASEQLRAVRARVNEANANLKRIESLRERGLVSVADLDAAKATALALTAELAAVNNGLSEAKAAAGFAEIHAPLAGRIVDRFAEPGATAIPGAKLLSIYNPLSVRLEAYVRESLSSQLAVGQQLEGEIPALHKAIQATVEEIVPAANNSARSFLVKARVEFDPQLLPGMYARLDIPVQTDEQLFVPAERIRQVGQQSVVWVWEDGSLVRRFVRLGRTLADGRVQISAGLSAGDWVVLPPSENG